MKVTAKLGTLVTFFIAAALLVGAQSAPDQAQTPGQRPTDPAQTQPQPIQEQAKPEPSQQPPAQPEQPAASQGQTETPRQAEPAQGEPRQDTNVPVLKHRRKPVHKKPASASASGKVVVKNGGAKEGIPELAPGSEEQRHRRESTGQLLATTDANMKSVAGRQLTALQRSMMQQIQSYVSQAKAAGDSGDLDRAHTLAYKAHLLSDELAKK